MKNNYILAHRRADAVRIRIAAQLLREVYDNGDPDYNLNPIRYMAQALENWRLLFEGQVVPTSFLQQVERKTND